MKDIKQFENQIAELEKQFRAKAFSDVEMSATETPIMGPEPVENEPMEDTPMDNFVDLVYCLKQSNEQAIVWHHQTTSFSVHKALNNYYDEIVERIDGLVESVSGIYGRPTGYELVNPVDYQSVEQVVAYFQALYVEVQTERKVTFQESWIQNQIDNIAELIAETLYLLSLK
jgi:Family of unknown function (DUF5856)